MIELIIPSLSDCTCSERNTSSCMSSLSKNPQKWRPRLSNAPYGVSAKLVTADFDALFKAGCHVKLLANGPDTVVLLTEND